MGGRGGTSNAASTSTIGNSASIGVENSKSRSSGNQWKYTVLEATSAGGGAITIGYPTATSYDNPNKNTTIANYDLKAGIFNEMGSRELKSHNINWSNVTEVSGQTYDLRGYLRDLGFKWDSGSKKWVK